MRKLIIDRSKWDCGSRYCADEDTRLLHPETGKMCCLGFAGEQLCNIERDVLNGKASPGDLIAQFQEDLPWLVDFDLHGNNSNEAMKLMGINDDRHETDGSREEKVKQRFLVHGIEVEFVGEYDPNYHEDYLNSRYEGE